MTRLMLSLLVLAVGCLTACADDETSETDPPPETIEPEATEVGEPTADPVLATIGPEGGTLVSDDGVLTLVVPAGAVDAPTEFGIQPITNNCFAAITGAYRLTPDGATFAVPVELHFAYTDEQIVGTGPGALGVAYQNDEGFWRWDESATASSDPKEVVLPTDHFTDFSAVKGWQLRAEADSVKPGKTVAIHVEYCLSQGGADENFMHYCVDFYETSATPPGKWLDVSTWALNGIKHDEAPMTDGRLVPRLLPGVTYTAPALPPSTNPVAVSVKTLPKWGNELIVAHILVIDPHWRGTSDVTLVADPVDGFTRTWTTHAEVNWVWDEAMMTYAAQGTVSYQVDGTYEQGEPPETCTVFAQYSGPIEGQLYLFDLGDGTQAYGGGGYTMANVTTEDSCAGSSTTSEFINWWPGFRPPDSDPTAQGMVKVDDDGTPFIEQQITFAGNGGTQTNAYLFELK